MTRIDPEHNFRHAHDLPPMTPAEIASQERDRDHAATAFLCAGIAAVVLVILLVIHLSSRAQGAFQMLRDPLDVAFEQHIEAETKKHCRYEWRMGRQTMWPERVLVCGEGEGVMFHVGQRVVCVVPHDQWETEGHQGINLPVKDGIYTIRAIFPGVTLGGLYVLLCEIHNAPVRTVIGDVEQRFNAEAFRPIVEKKTDISVFTSMLTPAPKTTVKA